MTLSQDITIAIAGFAGDKTRKVSDIKLLMSFSDTACIQSM